MSTKDISTASNPDLRGALPALRRAAAMARKIAIDTNTELVVVLEGRIVHIPAEVLRREATAEQGAERD